MRLGLQINQLDSGYTRALIRGVTDYSNDHAVDLLIFNGRNMGSPYGYEFQNTTIYSYATANNLDALVLATGTQCNFISTSEFLSHLQALAPLPTVSIAVPLERTPSVLVDNEEGIRSLLSHLVDEHRCRRIAIIKGPGNNPEAALRFGVYRDFLDARRIPFDPSLVMDGDFTGPSAVDALTLHLNRSGLDFDALFSTNDAMAIAVKSVFRSQGIRVPEDVLLAGFDDIDQARFETPSLTTVAQPLYEQARKAAELACELASGRDVPLHTVLPTRLVVRASCGCMPQSVAEFQGKMTIVPADRTLDGERFVALRNAAEHILGAGESEFVSTFTRMISEDRRLDRNLSDWQSVLTRVYREVSGKASTEESKLRLERAFHLSRILLFEEAIIQPGSKKYEFEKHVSELRVYLAQLISVVSIDDLVEDLHAILERIDIKSCAIAAYRKEIHRPRGMPFSIPNEAEILLTFDESGIHKRGKGTKTFDPSVAVLPEGLFSSRPRTLILISLFHRDEQLGYILLEPGDRDGSIYETLCVQLSSTIRGSLVFTAKQRAEEQLRQVLGELEAYNRKLSDLSQTDELTGLYNRRGFLSLGQRSLDQTVRIGKQGLVIFADLDGLKKINDTWGHEEGDEAIRAAAGILRSAFRSLDVIGRLGGDEFTVLASDLDAEFIEVVHERINRGVEKYNAESKKPYRLSLSLGAVPFSSATVVGLEELLGAADELLYQNKMKRKKDQKRE